jgi:hypothetical protein
MAQATERSGGTAGTPPRGAAAWLQNRAVLAGLIAASALLLYNGLPGRWDDVGLWDPEEIAVADDARALLAAATAAPAPTAPPSPSASPSTGATNPFDTLRGTSGPTPRPATGAAATANPDTARLGPSLIALGLRVFGVNERAGRPMIALVAALALVCIFLTGAPFLGTRGGLLAAVFAGGAPLFFLHARQLLGDLPFTFAAGAAFMTLVFFLLLTAPLHRAFAGAGFALAVFLCWKARAHSGLAVVLPAAAASLAVELSGAARRGARDRETLLALGGLLVAVLGVLAWSGASIYGLVRALDATAVADRNAATALLGASGGAVPADLSFDWVFEQIGLGFAPWSALLPLVAAVALGGAGAGAGAPAGAPPHGPGDGNGDGATRLHARLALHGLVWTVFAALALGTLGRLARVPYAPVVVPLALATAAAFEATVARRAVPAVFAFLCFAFGLLLARDLAGHPEAIVRLLVPFAAPKLPDAFADDFAPRIPLLVFGLGWAFAAATVAFDPVVARAPAAERSAARAAALSAARGAAPPVWAPHLPAAAPAALTRALERAAAALPLAWTARALRTSLVRAHHGALAVRRHTAWLLPALGLAVGGAAALVYIPAASAHLSQKGVYDAYHRLAAPGEEIASFGVKGGGADYYLSGAVHPLASQGELMTYLKAPVRRFVLVGAAGLAGLHIAAEKEGIHLYVLDDSNANQLLVSNRLNPGEEDKNVISRYVAKAPPAAGTYTPVNADLEGKLTLLGYALDKKEVSRGGSFTLTLYLKVNEKLGRAYKVFYHVDGPGDRIKGDHVPVDGKYATTYWQPGDYITDVHTFNVGLGQASGLYTVWGGFYYDGTNDDSRLKVRNPGAAAHDGTNRLGIAKVTVR